MSASNVRQFKVKCKIIKFQLAGLFLILCYIYLNIEKHWWKKYNVVSYLKYTQKRVFMF